MNDLLVTCTELEIGCKIGTCNISVIAYCYDLFLLTSSKFEIEKLLRIVENYALNWKLTFNVDKCKNLTIHPSGSKNKTLTKLYLDNVQLTQSKNLIHLGLPIGPPSFIKEYWQNKMKSTISSFYTLNGIGMRPCAMSPLTLAKIFTIYCQPKFLYGLEMIYIS